MGSIQKNLKELLESLIVDDYSKASDYLGKVVQEKIKERVRKASLTPLFEKKSKKKSKVKDKSPDGSKMTDPKNRVVGKAKGNAFTEDLPKAKGKKALKEGPEVHDLDTPIISFNLKTTLKGAAREGYEALHDYKGKLNTLTFPLINKVNDLNGDLELSLGELTQLTQEVFTLKDKLEKQGEDVIAEYLNELANNLDHISHLNSPDYQGSIDNSGFDNGSE